MDRILLPYLPLSPLRELRALTFHSSHMSEAFAVQVFFFLPAHMPLAQGSACSATVALGGVPDC